MERDRCKITTFTEKRVNEKASERVRLIMRKCLEKGRKRKERKRKKRKTVRLPAPRLNSNPTDSGCTATDSKNLSQDRTISVKQNETTRVRITASGRYHWSSK